MGLWSVAAWGATLEVVVTDRQTGLPAAGADVYLSGTARAQTTDRGGSCVFAGLAPGYYRPAVAGACAEWLDRVGVVPGADNRVSVVVDLGCAAAASFVAAPVTAEPSGDFEEWLEVAPTPCTGPGVALRLDRTGQVRVRLAVPPWAPASVERSACEACVEALFVEVEAALASPVSAAESAPAVPAQPLADAGQATVQRAGQAPATWELRGAVAGRRFSLGWTTLRALPAAGFAARLLDLLGYWDCLAEPSLAPVPVTWSVEVGEGDTCTVVARSDTSLSDCALSVATPGSSGVRSMVGDIAPRRPLRLSIPKAPAVMVRCVCERFRVRTERLEASPQPQRSP